jgi:hypothetical protein
MGIVDYFPAIFATAGVLVVLLLAASVGLTEGQLRITEDCAKMGQFRLKERVYECKAKP